jgi:hypothetical protein
MLKDLIGIYELFIKYKGIFYLKIIDKYNCNLIYINKYIRFNLFKTKSAINNYGTQFIILKKT